MFVLTTKIYFYWKLHHFKSIYINKNHVIKLTYYSLNIEKNIRILSCRVLVYIKLAALELPSCKNISGPSLAWVLGCYSTRTFLRLGASTHTFWRIGCFQFWFFVTWVLSNLSFCELGTICSTFLVVHKMKSDYSTHTF